MVGLTNAEVLLSRTLSSSMICAWERREERMSVKEGRSARRSDSEPLAPLEPRLEGHLLARTCSGRWCLGLGLVVVDMLIIATTSVLARRRTEKYFGR